MSPKRRYALMAPKIGSKITFCLAFITTPNQTQDDQVTLVKVNASMFVFVVTALHFAVASMKGKNDRFRLRSALQRKSGVIGRKKRTSIYIITWYYMLYTKCLIICRRY